MNLTDNLRRQILDTLDRQMQMLCNSRTTILAAEKLEILLREAGIDAHAFGNLNPAGCAVCVQSQANPAAIEAALVQAGIEFMMTDGTRAGDYHFRSLLTKIDDVSISLMIRHQREKAVA